MKIIAFILLCYSAIVTFLVYEYDKHWLRRPYVLDEFTHTEFFTEGTGLLVGIGDFEPVWQKVYLRCDDYMLKKCLFFTTATILGGGMSLHFSIKEADEDIIKGSKRFLKFTYRCREEIYTIDIVRSKVFFESRFLPPERQSYDCSNVFLGVELGAEIRRGFIGNTEDFRKMKERLKGGKG